MISSAIITQCINDLEKYKNSLSYICGDSESAHGYNCAIDCIKDSLKSRIEALADSLKEYDPQDKIDENCECYNEISSMLEVLNADCQNLSDSEFDNTFEEKMRECIKELSLVLEKYS